MSRCIIGQQYENYTTFRKLNQSQVLKRFQKCEALNQNCWAQNYCRKSRLKFSTPDNYSIWRKTHSM